MLRFRQFQYLIENRVDFVKKKYEDLSVSHDPHSVTTDEATGKERPLHPHEVIDDIHTELEPQHRQHLDWAVGQYHHGNYKLEDMPRINQNLLDFAKAKSKLPPNERDLKQYSLNPDREAVNERIEKRKKMNAEQGFQPFGRVPPPKLKKNLHDTLRAHEPKADPNFPDGPRFKGHPGAKEIFNDGKGNTVHTLHTHEAAQAARASCGFKPNEDGGWCVGWKNPQYFNRYSKGLHLLQTSDNKKSLIHFPSDQHMDKDDNDIDTKKFVEQHPVFKNANLTTGGSFDDDRAVHFMKPEEIHQKVDEHLTLPHLNIDYKKVAKYGTKEQIDTGIEKFKKYEGGHLNGPFSRAIAQRGFKPHLDHLMQHEMGNFESFGMDLLAHKHPEHVKKIAQFPIESPNGYNKPIPIAAQYLAGQHKYEESKHPQNSQAYIDDNNARVKKYKTLARDVHLYHGLHPLAKEASEHFYKLADRYDTDSIAAQLKI